LKGELPVVEHESENTDPAADDTTLDEALSEAAADVAKTPGEDDQAPADDDDS
jgi:hypothetical protein